MGTLEECREHIDGGEVAELALLRPGHVGSEAIDGTVVTISRNSLGYLWTLYRLQGQTQVRIRTHQFADWQRLTIAVEGEQTISSDWTLRARQPYEQSVD